jgi:SAM-dependent methyltransferase
MKAAHYDSIYDCKLYEYESQCVDNLAYKYLRAPGRRLLDVACGTGRHIEYLKRHFQVEGIDISEDMIELARRRNPDVTFDRLDMTEFRMGRNFDVVTCLFSSIGYVKTLDNLARAINCMAAHLAAGGILLIEPWFTPGDWMPRTIHSIFVDRPELKIARIAVCSVQRRISIIDAHYLVGTPEQIEHHSEREELGLFERSEIRSAMEDAGLEVAFEAEGLGLSDKGVFVGRRLQME